MTEVQTPRDASRLARIGRQIETAALCLVLAIMVVLAAGQVVARDVFSAAIPGADEGLRLLVLWAAMIGAVAASRDDVHLRIDILARVLPARPRAIVAACVDMFAAAVSLTIGWYSARFVLDSWKFGDTLLGSWPAWPFQAILPLAFLLIAWRYACLFQRRVREILD